MWLTRSRRAPSWEASSTSRNQFPKSQSPPSQGGGPGRPAAALRRAEEMRFRSYDRRVVERLGGVPGVDRPDPRRAGIQIETIPEKSVLARSFGKISSMVTFNVTSRTPSSALDDSEPTLLLFNRGPGAVLVGVTEIFDRAEAMLLQPRRVACLAVPGGRITVVPVAPASRPVLDVTVEARRTPAQRASVRADRPVEPGEFGRRLAWLRKKTAGILQGGSWRQRLDRRMTCWRSGSQDRAGQSLSPPLSSTGGGGFF